MSEKEHTTKQHTAAHTSEIKTTATAGFPNIRLRRLRTTQWMRDLIEEHAVTTKDLIYPVFVCEGKNQRTPVPSMPGVQRCSIDALIKDLKNVHDQGISTVALFPSVLKEKKTMQGDEGLNPDNLMCRTIRAVKNALPTLGLITDVALDPYTTHGHDGLVEDGRVLNDSTVETLCKQALTQAHAGANIIAPSDMMDGRVGAIRAALDKEGFTDVAILAYAAKYASSFYGPFRDAVNSGDFLKGDKKTYQMNPANADIALREVELDIAEGADIVMVKPGLIYLDIIQRIKQNFNIPIFAYHVSGEYAMLKAASEKGWLNYENAIMEQMIAFKRAGCNAIFTYAAPDIAKILNA